MICLHLTNDRMILSFLSSHHPTNNYNYENNKKQLVEEAEMYSPGWGKTIFNEAQNRIQLKQQQSEEESQENTPASDSKEKENDNEKEKDADTKLSGEDLEEAELRASRIAQELLEEEENEKLKEQKAKSGKGKKNKKK